MKVVTFDVDTFGVEFVRRERQEESPDSIGFEFRRRKGFHLFVANQTA